MVEDGILIKGQRIMIPESLQEDILQKLHSSYQGIEKTRLKACTCVYWRNIDKDIEDHIGSCDICLKYSRKEQKQSTIPHDLPSGPWQNLGTDLFKFNDRTYLIVADYYSKMPFIRAITSESSHAVIAKLKTIFGEHGIPDKLCSDGGPCYSGYEFEKFTEDWRFKHIMSSPHYAQSNGFIERAIQTVKLVLKKAESTNMDPELALLCVRTTPISNRIGSPTELLYERRVNVNLPLRMDGKEDIVLALNKRQEQQKFYYDRSSRDRSDLQVGQTVGLQDPKICRISCVPFTLPLSCLL